MFGPNCTTQIRQDIDGHHREPAFAQTLEDLESSFRRRLRVNSEWDLLFLTGSGTLGIEAAIASLQVSLAGPRERGVFTARMRQLLEGYGKHDEASPRKAEVALETSHSDPLHSDATAAQDPFLLDAVSSFPYYPVPAETAIWVTVSGKQLGASPGIAIVAVREDAWRHLNGPELFSYLNLARHREYAKSGQTPHTPALPLFADLAQKLSMLDVDELRSRIDANSDRLVELLGADNVVGAKRCPAITVPKSAMPLDLATRFELYGLRTNSPTYQVFTYSEPQSRYETLFAELSRLVEA